MATASSARNLVVGSGTVSVTSGSRLLTFSAVQTFKPGTTIVVDYAGTPQYFTIDAGADVKWVSHQPAVATASTKAFKSTDPSTSRARGSGEIIPDALHYMYQSPMDNSGAADWFFYYDTVVPEKGRHPYTKDRFTGAAVNSSKTVQAIVMDLASRVKLLEGAMRAHGTPGDALNPDKRFDAIEARLNALDSGGAPSYTAQQLLDYGDA